MDRDTSHGANLYALGFVKMTYALGALARVNLINLRSKVDGLIGALRFTHITIDAFISDHQGHININPLNTGQLKAPRKSRLH
jgi:hypothetical protein